MKPVNVEFIRNSLHLSRQELAQRIGTSYETICRWEKGKRQPSNVYIAKLLELHAKRGGGGERTESQWVFWDSNLDRVKRAAMRNPGLTLGIVRAVNDLTGRFFLATIQLCPEVPSMLDLRPRMIELTKARAARRTRIVGAFVGGDGKKEPKDAPVMLMRDGTSSGANHCVLFDRRTEQLTLWRLKERFSPYSNDECLEELAYSVIGQVIAPDQKSRKKHSAQRLGTAAQNQ